MRASKLILLALVASIGLGQSACGGFKTPSIPFTNKKSKEPKIKGERIPVLTLNQKLEPSSALSGIGFSIPAPSDLADWPVAGGNIEHSIEHVKAGDDFKIAWRHRIGVGDSRATRIVSQPVVSDGVLYALDGKARVTALDAKSGKELWSSDLSPKKGKDREALGGGLAVSGGDLFFSSGFRFIADLDAKTGKVKWKTDTAAPLHSSPAVSAGKVLVVDVLDQLHAYDAATGAEAWNYQALEEPARVEVASSPAIAGDMVVAPFASGEMTAVRVNNGADVWSFVLSLTNRNNALSEIRDIAGLPVINRGQVFAASHSGLIASVDLRSGQPKWTQAVTAVSTPWVSGDVVYVMDQSGQLICLSRDAGQAYWIQSLNEPLRKKFRANWSGVILASNRLLSASSHGELRAFDPHTGEKTASLHIGEPVTLAPIAADGLLYIVTDKGDVVAIR